MKTLIAGAAALALCLLTAGAAAQPAPETPQEKPIRFLSPVRIISDGGSDTRQPPGVYLPEDKWQEIDREVRRLQEQETRLTAERDNLLDDAGPGWGWLAGVGAGLVAGMAVGYWAL